MLEKRKQGSADNLYNYLADQNCRDIWEMADNLDCSNHVKRKPEEALDISCSL